MSFPLRWLAALVAATTAFALVPHAAAGKAFGGVVPDVPTGALAAGSATSGAGSALPGARLGHARATPVAHAADLPYGGGPVLHANRTHLIFWQPSGSGLSFDPGYTALIVRFLRNVAAASHHGDNVYGLSGQYTDSSGPAAYASTFRGAVFDDDGLPPSGCAEPPLTGPGWSDCLSDQQIETEIEHVVAADRLPTGPEDIYFLVTPDGLGSCESTGPENCALGGSAPGSFCGYHSSTPSDAILYAVIPYNAVSGHCQSGNPRPNASTADPTLSTLSHEHNEVVTDPLGTAYVDSGGNEDGDLCITQFGPPVGGSGSSAWNEVIAGGHYYLQEEWSNDDHGCRPRAEPDTVSIAVRGVAPAGTESLAGRAADPHGVITAYDWFFGDRRASRGQAVRHRYRRSGRYRVVLRVVDSAENYAYAGRWVTVRR